jgi:hypothetical protein
MRRFLVLPVLGVCVLVITLGSTAVAGGGSRYYAGNNSQGQKLLFTVDHTASGPMFDPIFTNLISRCPDGQVVSAEFSFQGFQIPIRHGKFRLVLNDLSDRFRWNGTIAATKAFGQEYNHIAAFTSTGGLQECGASSLSWTAKRLVPASAATVAPRASFVVKVTKRSNGAVHFSITH